MGTGQGGVAPRRPVPATLGPTRGRGAGPSSRSRRAGRWRRRKRRRRRCSRLGPEPCQENRTSPARPSMPAAVRTATAPPALLPPLSPHLGPIVWLGAPGGGEGRGGEGEGGEKAESTREEGRGRGGEARSWRGRGRGKGRPALSEGGCQRRRPPSAHLLQLWHLLASLLLRRGRLPALRGRRRRGPAEASVAPSGGCGRGSGSSSGSGSGGDGGGLKRLPGPG